MLACGYFRSSSVDGEDEQLLNRCKTEQTKTMELSGKQLGNWVSKTKADLTIAMPLMRDRSYHFDGIDHSSVKHIVSGTNNSAIISRIFTVPATHNLRFHFDGADRSSGKHSDVKSTHNTVHLTQYKSSTIATQDLCYYFDGTDRSGYTTLLLVSLCSHFEGTIEPRKSIRV